MEYNKKDYNNKLIEYLKEIYKYLEKIDNTNFIKSYKYDFEKEEEKQIQLNKYEETDNKWINYYWIEYTKDKKEYKISLFYKDLDTGSGNIHVLPGVIQFLIKNWDNNNTLNDVKKNKSENSKGKPFSDDMFSPLLNSNQIHYIDNDIVECLDKLFNKECIEPKKINNELLEKYYEKNIPDTLFFGKGNSDKYKIIKWHDKNKEYWCSYYYSEFNKNGNIFPKFGQIQFWRGINKENKSGKSPNEYINGEWKFYYPNKESMDDNIKGISTWQINNNKNKLCNFIELIKRNQKSFNPDINLQEDTSILEDEFNEFVKLCSIIEKNKNESTENILKKIMENNHGII